MLNPITRALHKTLQSLTADSDTVRGWMLSVAKREAEELGLNVIEVVRYRSTDHKVVLRCECPDRGMCALKVWPRHLVRGSFRNHVAAMQLAREYNPGIFPEVYYVGTHSALLEYVGGQQLKFLPQNRWMDVDLLDFLRRVHAFSRSAPRAEHNLSSEEIRIHAESYLRRSLGYIRYQSRRDKIFSMGRLYADRRTIEKNVRTLEHFASGVTLPAFTILSDLTSGNVLHTNCSNRLFVVDVEDITHGVLGFDCAWLLTTLARGLCPEDLLVEAYRYITADDFVATDAEARLTRLLLKILLENDLKIIGSSLDKTRGLLTKVDEDLQADTRLVHA